MFMETRPVSRQENRQQGYLTHICRDRGLDRRRTYTVVAGESNRAGVAAEPAVPCIKQQVMTPVGTTGLTFGTSWHAAPLKAGLRYCAGDRTAAAVPAVCHGIGADPVTGLAV